MSGHVVCQELDPHATYWDRGIESVPVMTGAASVMDGADLVDAFSHLGLPLPLTGAVLDVGCGTGRLASLCNGSYFGVDISADAVAYAARAGLQVARLIGYGPAALADKRWTVDTICCLSVFTHIDESERRDYLAAFAQAGARALVVDIIPGSGDGEVALWTADVETFESQLAAFGWHVEEVYARTSPDAVTHRYYRCAQ